MKVNKKVLNLILLVISFILLGIALIYNYDEAFHKYQGIILGLGAGLFGLSLSNLIMIHHYHKNPDKQKAEAIEFHDERNEVIRNKAKAKCSDILQWVIMGFAWVTIFADFPLWITLTLMGVFCLKNVLELYLMSRYAEEL